MVRMNLAQGGGFFCKLLEGVYPSWRAVVPDLTFGCVPLDVDALLSAMQVSRWFGESITLVSESGRVSVAAQAADCGESRWSLPLDLGEGFRRTFNQGYLADGLCLMDGATDAWFGKDKNSAAVITDGMVKYVLMPMRTEEAE